MSKGLKTRGVMSVESKRKASLRSKRIAANTADAYARATRQLQKWLRGREISDELIAEYIAELHENGKAVSTISMVVAAVNWLAKNKGIDTPIAGETEQTLAGIRRESAGRGPWTGRRSHMVRSGRCVCRM